MLRFIISGVVRVLRFLDVVDLFIAWKFGVIESMVVFFRVMFDFECLIQCRWFDFGESFKY